MSITNKKQVSDFWHISDMDSFNKFISRCEQWSERVAIEHSEHKNGLEFIKEKIGKKKNEQAIYRSVGVEIHTWMSWPAQHNIILYKFGYVAIRLFGQAHCKKRTQIKITFRNQKLENIFCVFKLIEQCGILTEDPHKDPREEEQADAEMEAVVDAAVSSKKKHREKHPRWTRNWKSNVTYKAKRRVEQWQAVWGK